MSSHDNFDVYQVVKKISSTNTGLEQDLTSEIRGIVAMLTLGQVVTLRVRSMPYHQLGVEIRVDDQVMYPLVEVTND